MDQTQEPQVPKKVFAKISSGTEDDLIFRNESFLELAVLYYEKCDFKNAVEKLEAVKHEAWRLQLYDNYFRSLTILLRIHAERLEQGPLEKLVGETSGLGKSLPQYDRYLSKVEYTQGVFASYKSDYMQAEAHFQRAEQAVDNFLANHEVDNRMHVGLEQDRFYALFGLITVCSNIRKFDEAMERIDALERKIHEFESTEEAKSQGYHAENIDCSILITKGNIYRVQGEYQKALEMLWKAHSNLKSKKVWYYYYYVLLGLGRIYLDMDDHSRAGIFFDLIRDAANSLELKALKQVLDQETNKVNNGAARLVIDRERKIVIEKEKGEIHFERRFILLEILYLLASEPGEVFTKDILVERIWRESYNPMIHDSKVYTSISRLRRLIEPDFKRPRYILNERDGYSLNPVVQVEELGNWRKDMAGSPPGTLEKIAT